MRVPLGLVSAAGRLTALGIALTLPNTAAADWGEDWGTMIWGQTVSTPDVETTSSFVMRAAPNPFRAGTTIHYSLPTQSSVDLRVLSVTGRLVRSLEQSAARAAGSYTVPWDGRDTSGHTVASGVYFYQIVTDELRQSRRLVFQR